jgi:membrane protease YdiL (CAAX protease family)
MWAAIDGVLGLILAVACVLTWHFTASAAPPRRVERGRFLPVQLAACAIVFLATAFDLPGWSAFHNGIFTIAAASMPDQFANGITNFITYCVPIAAVLFALGVPLRRQGLGKFQKGSLPSAISWLALPIAVFVIALAFGKIHMGTVASAWLSNLLQNGVSEEFLWRGAIMGRLRAVMSPVNAIVLQALLFGAWHFHADMIGYHGDFVNAVADMIASQALFGVAAGFVTLRTGNIAIASAFHLLFDSLQVFQ